jgi:hypothetical protein
MPLPLRFFDRRSGLKNAIWAETEEKEREEKRNELGPLDPSTKKFRAPRPAP